MGVLDDLLPSATPKAAKPQAGLLDDLLTPAPPKAGVLDDLLPSVGTGSARGSAELTQRPGLTEGKVYSPAGGLQFQVKDGQLADANPERSKFVAERPELFQSKKPEFKLDLPPALANLPKGRQVTGQEAAQAEGLTKTGFEGNITPEMLTNEGAMGTMERIGSRLVTPVLQAIANPAEGFQPLQEGGSLLDTVQLARELAAPQGEGKFATFEEFAGLQERPGFAQGYEMAPPETEAERTKREIAVMLANAVNPANPINLMAELATGGAATGISRAATAVPRDIAAGPLDNLGAALMDGGGRRMAEDFGLVRPPMDAPAPRQEPSIAGVNLMDEAPPVPDVPAPVAAPRADLPAANPDVPMARPGAGVLDDLLPEAQVNLTQDVMKVTDGTPLPEVNPDLAVSTPGTGLLDDLLPPPKDATLPVDTPSPAALAPEIPPPVVPAAPGVLDDLLPRPAQAWKAGDEALSTQPGRQGGRVSSVEVRDGVEWLEVDTGSGKFWRRADSFERKAPTPSAPEPVPVPAAPVRPTPEQILQRSFGESPDSPFHAEIQRVQSEMQTLERQRMQVEQRGAGPLSREQRALNMKQSDELRARAQKLQAEHDLLRKQAAEEATQFEASLADEVAPASKTGPGGVRLSAFGAAEIGDFLKRLDRIPVEIYKGITKLSDQAVTAAEKTVIGKKALRSWRHWMKAGGNAPEELLQMNVQMQDHLGAVGAQIADEIVPRLRGDGRQNFLARLAPGGKWTVLEQQAVGDVIQGNAPRVPLPQGGAEAAQMAKELLVRDGLDVLSQTLAINKTVMQQLAQDEIIEIGQLIRGQKAMTESPANLQAIAQNSIRELEKMGALEAPNLNGVRAIKDNLLHERTFFRRAGRYMPRMYEKFEWDQLAQQTLDDLVNLAPPDMSMQLRQTLVEAMQPTATANQGIQNRMKTIIRDRFLRRKDLPPELRQALGEILEPAFPVAKGHYQLRQAIEMQKMTRFIASRPEWVQPEGTVGFFDHATGQPYVKMAADTPEFGVLQGRLVHPDVADFLEMQRLNGSAGEQFFDQLVSAWKFGKVVLNPASHARNLMSNVMMADLAGMGNNPFSWKRHYDAAVDYLRQGTWYKEARDNGVLGGTWHEAEIKNLADGLLGPAAGEKQSANWLIRTGEYIKAGARGMGEAAGAEDQLFKLSVYKWARESGMSPADAKQYVKDWMPDYRQNGRLVQVMAGRGQVTNRSGVVEKLATVGGKMFANPFINFTASALPKAAKAAMGVGLRKGEMRAMDPSVAMRFWKYPIAAAGITAASAKALGMTSREVEAAQPDYMRSWVPGNYPLMPWRDQHGRLQHLDLSYILPWGDFTKMRFNQDDPSPPPILSSGGPATPLIEALMFNKSLFTGKEVWSPGMTPEQKHARIIDHIYKGLMPSFVPGIPGLTGSEASLSAAVDPQEWKYALARSGGYSMSKLFSSILSIPDYKGRQRAFGTTLADVFLGLKVQPVDEAATARSKAFERVQVIRSIKEEIKRATKDQGWNAVPELRQRYIQGLRERQANILRGGQVQQGNPLLQDLWDSILQPDTPAPGILPVADAGEMG